MSCLRNSKNHDGYFHDKRVSNFCKIMLKNFTLRHTATYVQGAIEATYIHNIVPEYENANASILYDIFCINTFIYTVIHIHIYIQMEYNGHGERPGV